MENSENSEQSLTFDKRSERLRGEEYDQVSSRTFNLVMVLTILYGLVLNVALVHYAIFHISICRLRNHTCIRGSDGTS